MHPGPRVQIDETQQELSPPSARMRHLAYAWVVNTSGAAVYISVWSGSGTSRTASQRTAGPWLVPDGHAAPVLFEHPANGGCVVAAHTASDATGAPASAVDFVPVWDA